MLGLVGCSAEKEESKSEADQIVLDFPSWQATEPGFEEFWKVVIKDFEAENENVKINIYQVPFSNYVDTLTTLYAADTAPQITHIASRWFAQFSEMGWFEPLTDKLEETEILDKWTNLQNGLKSGDDYYGVLLLGNGYSMYYNKQLFENKGINIPTTFDEFMKAAKDLTIDENGDGDPEIYGFGACQVTDANFYNEVTSFLVGNGTKWSDERDLAPMTSPETIKVLSDYQSLFKNNYTPIGLSVEQKRQYFIEGKMAMIFDGPWVGSLIDNAAEEIRPQLQVARIPFENVPGSVSNSLHIPVGATEAEKDLAWKFIQMITEDDYQRLYMEKVGSPSPNASSINDELLAEKPFLAQFASDAEEANEILPSGYEKDYGQFTQYVIDGVMSMVTEPYADVEDAVNEMKDKIIKELN